MEGRWVVCNHSHPECGYCRHARPHSTVDYRGEVEEEDEPRNCEATDFCHYVGCDVRCVLVEKANATN